jgi:phosphatidylglycerol:prolipoprotein diacylglycerol transferase
MLTIGPVHLYWYGAMYAISFILIDYLMKKKLVTTNFDFDSAQIDKILLTSLIMLLIGGRLGYVIFYNIEYYLYSPLKIFFIWEGGMSFHGALIGILIGLVLLSRKENLSFLKIADYIVIFIPIGLFLGRIGNFINSELYGYPTNSDWGIIFPLVDNIPRHPSMLYEAFLEGIIIFYVLKTLSNLNLNNGTLSSIFLVLYAIFRFIVEFIRVPDSHIGYIWSNWLTMGQLLSIPMLLIGTILFYFSYRGKFTS